ncbi:MAG: hypothetical protein IT385_07990 [Deltaproteobacteria bacterium]|nr:hypothetical protein [Deltaproteobacteria bacterium]
MSESLTASEIDDQIGLRKVRFQQVIADIRTVLRADLEAFVMRETKRTFLSLPTVGETMSTERVAALKKRALEVGKAAASRIDGELQDPELWWNPGGEPANTRDLVGAVRAWERIATVEVDLKALLEEFGLADGGTPTYKLPAYFVGGLYMPSLAEHYWRIVHETKELEEQRKKLADNEVRERLQAKWDEV